MVSLCGLEPGSLFLIHQKGTPGLVLLTVEERQVKEA